MRVRRSRLASQHVLINKNVIINRSVIQTKKPSLFENKADIRWLHSHLISILMVFNIIIYYCIDTGTLNNNV